MKRALIAGGGVAGLSAAVLLDELGYSVKLIEKRPILGGRTYSFSDNKTGLTIDNGQHLLIGAYHESLNYLESIGAKSKIEWLVPTNVPLVTEQNEKHVFSLGQLPSPFNLLKACFSYPGFSFKEKLMFLKLGRTLNRQDDLKNQTVNEWLVNLGQSDNTIKNFWEILTLATLNDDPQTTTADGLATVLKKSYFGGQKDGFLIYPKVGLTELFVKPAVDYLTLRGHEIVCGKSLKGVRIIDNKVQSFQFSDGNEEKADLYICALPFHQIANVLPNTLLNNHDQLKHLSKFTGSPIVSINLFYDKPIMTEDFIGSASTRTHWFFKKTNKAPYHIVGVISGGYDYLDKSKEEIVELATKDLKKLYPAVKESQLIHSLVNKERQATLSCRKGINQWRPKQHILDDFFLLGDWTATNLPPTIESAIVSSTLMAKHLQN